MSPPKTPTTTTAPAEPPPEPTPPPAPTPAAEWRRAGVYALPTDRLAELRWPGLYALAVQGEIPNPLAADVLRLVSGAAAEKDGAPEPSEDELIAAYRKNARAFLGVAARCMVSPRLVLDREPDYARDEIGPADMHELDVLWIYAHFVQRGPAAETVRPFRRA